MTNNIEDELGMGATINTVAHITFASPIPVVTKMIAISFRTLTRDQHELRGLAK